MKIFLGAYSLFYLLMAIRLFNVWFKIFKKDYSMSPEDRQGYMMILVIITILWPVVVPFAYLELLNAKETVKTSSTAYDRDLRPTEVGAAFACEVLPALEELNAPRHQRN